MKRLFSPLLSIVILFTCVSLSAQSSDKIINKPNFDKKQLHFGYYVGLNKKGYKLNFEYDPSLGDVKSDYVIVDDAIGFNVGLVVDYRLIENLNLRFEPGLSSNTKVLTYDARVLGSNGINGAGIEREISGTYLRFPFLLKYSSNRFDNMRAFVIGGLSYDYNFSSNQKNKNDNLSGQFRMKTHNFMYEVGFGVDIYLPYFKFSPSLRGVFALNNELVQDNTPGSPYTAPIDYMGTRGIFLNLTFE